MVIKTLETINDLTKVFYHLALAHIGMAYALDDLDKSFRLEKCIIIKTPNNFLIYRNPKEYLIIKRKNKKWL